MAFQPLSETVAATIASGQTDSSAVSFGGANPVGIELPSTMTSVKLSFKRLASDGSYQPIYNDDGTLYQPTITQGTYLALDPSKMAGVHAMKIVAASAEAGIRVLNVVYRPV